MLCLCCVTGYFMNVSFPCACVLSDADPAAFMCTQCVGVLLQRIDS